MSDRPLVTVSLVTYNGLRWLPGCLASIWAQRYTPFEVIIRDNASIDGSAEWLAGAVAGRNDVQLVLGDENLGFSRAHNDAIRVAKGEFVCLVNQDLLLEEGFLEAAISGFQTEEVGSVQGKLYQLVNENTKTSVVDSAGLSISRSRRVVSRGQGHATSSDYLMAELIFGVDGACPVYRMAALESVRQPSAAGGWEYLDEDFFIYKEDVDLAWRLQLFGWAALYLPDAVAWHARGAGDSATSRPMQIIAHRRKIASWVKRLSWRNHRLMQLKNEDASEVMRDLPYIVWHEIRALMYLAIFNPRNLSAIADLARKSGAARRKRRYIQGRRVRRGIGGWLLAPQGPEPRSVGSAAADHGTERPPGD